MSTNLQETQKGIGDTPSLTALEKLQLVDPDARRHTLAENSDPIEDTNNTPTQSPPQTYEGRFSSILFSSPDPSAPPTPDLISTKSKTPHVPENTPGWEVRSAMRQESLREARKKNRCSIL